MVLNDDQKLGLYVALPLYFTMFGIMGILGWRAKVKRASSQPKEDLDGEGEMVSHFVAGKSLGSFVTVMTIFASLFSGYTMVGVPNEAFTAGFKTLRWIPSKLFMAFGYMCTSPRLRRISLIRHYHSPLDFVTDRFRSQFLRYSIFVILLVPSIIYLAAQPITLKGNFNDLFGLEDNNVIAPVAICAFILVLEWIGGLNVVAYTDSAQGILMILAFVLMSSTLCYIYGGWGSDIFNPKTYPEPTFFQVPSTEDQVAMWSFSLQWISFLVLPHFQQRTYASGDFKSMKLAYFVISLAPWLTMLVGVFSGTLGVYLLQGQEVSNPFTGVVAELMGASGFGYVSGLLILVGSVAAIISTADSLLIATTHMVMSEVVNPAMKNASHARVSFVSKIVSFTVMALGLVIALTDDGALSDLAAVQNGMTLQAVPTFLIGLFAAPRFTPHAWVIALGAIVGFITTVVINYTWNEDEDNYFMNAGVWGLCHNIGIMFVFEMALRLCQTSEWRAPKWDMPKTDSFGGDMLITHDWLSGLMRNIKEPFKSEWFVGLFVLTSILLLPGNSAGLPELGEQAADGTYPDFAPTTVGGVPDWIFKLLMGSVVMTSSLLWATSRLPSNLDDLSDLNDDSAYVPQKKSKGSLPSVATSHSPSTDTIPNVSRTATTDCFVTATRVALRPA